MFNNIGSIIKDFFKEKKIEFSKEREKIEVFWEKNIEKKTKSNAEIIGFKNNTLIIKAKNPSWRMELFQKKEAIKKKLKKKLKSK